MSDLIVFPVSLLSWVSSLRYLREVRVLSCTTTSAVAGSASFMPSASASSSVAVKSFSSERIETS